MRIIYSIICLLASICFANAQYQNFDLETPNDHTDNKNYVGRDYVRLLPGYAFNAVTSGKTMNAKVSSALTTTEANALLATVIPNANSDVVTAIDNTKAVGQIPISSSVSQSGAKCYNVPIEIVPGRMGFQPNISLSYNSQAGNGVVGMGWNISGLSSIERVNKNVFFDGKNDIPALTSNIDNPDAFALDGNRLIEISRTVSKINYETVQGNIKVTAIFAVDNMPRPPIYLTDISYFIVYYPNGNIGRFNYYGHGSNPYKNISYPITDLTDLTGNTITFTYDATDIADLNGGSNNEVYYIDEINYGKSNDKPNFAKIKFSYDTTRPDQIFSLESSKSCVYRKRLVKIESFANPDLIRTYQLSYSNIDPRIPSNQNDVSRLTQISNFVNNGSIAIDKLNPLKFYYGEEQTLTTSTQPTSLINSSFDLTKINIVRGKFDNNSLNDALLVYPKKEVYKTVNYAFQSAYLPEEEIKVYQNLNQATSTPQIINAESGFLGVLSVNYYGKSTDAIIKINSLGINSSEESIKFKIYNADLSYREETFSHFQIGYRYNYSGQQIPSIIPKVFYTGNFSGEGKNEIICIPKMINSGSSPIYIVQSWDNIGHIGVMELNAAFTKGDNDIVYAIDIDGDNQTELLHVTNAQTDLYKYKEGQGLIKIGQWTLTISDFMSKTTIGTFTNYNGTTAGTTSSSEESEAFFADMNGDNKIDIIKAPLRIKRHYKYNSLNVAALRCVKCGASYGKFPEFPNGCPICGDKKYINTVDNYCHFSDMTHPVVCYRPLNSNGECPIHGKFAAIEYDWNQEGHNDWTYFYTDGVSQPIAKVIIGPTCHGNDKINIQDVDCDANPEIIISSTYKGENYSVSSLDFYLNRDGDNGFVKQIQFSGDSQIIPFDLNSDLNHAELISINSTGIQKMSFSQNKAKNNQISVMINSLGIVDKTDYGQLYQGANYTPGTAASFPNSDFQGPLWVAIQNSAMYNKQLISNTTYTYTGAILHKQGLGIRGFSTLKVTDLMTNKAATTEFDPYKMGAITKQISDNEESAFTYNFINYSNMEGGNKKMKLLPNTQTITDKIKGNTATVTYSLYDDYGNAGKEVTSFSGGITSTVENTYQNTITPNLNLIGMPLTKKTTNVRDTKTFIQSENYVYYPDNRLQYVRKYIGSKYVSETEYEYNTDYGTVSKETAHNKITNNAADDLITSNVYKDEDKCSLWKKTDPFGLTTEYSYNFTTRLLTGVKDYLGNTVTYGYDAWRRKNYELRPDGTSTTISWDWNTTDVNRLIAETQTSTGQPQTITYADAFGRETRKAAKEFDGIGYIFTDKEYDNFGRLNGSSVPYKEGTNVLWTTYTYDKYNRPTKVAQPNGSNTTYSYTGNQVSENKDGVATSKITDSTGKTISTTDAGGTVSYTYRADGQPENVNAAGVVISFDYDDYGRQTKLIDPSAGTVETIHVDANHKVTQKWNSGKEIIIISNKFGQPTSKTTPDFTTTYSYDPTYGRPTGSTSTNGTSKSLDYDTFGRLWKMTETVSGKTYQEVYGYDDKGRIGSITYNTNPGANSISYPVTYKYNTNGYLNQLLNGTQVLRQVNSVNALGQETNVLLGNGLTTTKNYTPEGLWTNVTTSGNIQNMSFDFNRINGTLNSRTDNRHGLTESFNYDNMYRLKSFGSKTMDYDTNGNIKTKSDVGTASIYKYNDETNTKPYTLFKIDNATTVDLANELDIVYTVMSRPTSIVNTSTGLNAAFSYNDSYDRASMQLKQGTTETMNKYYFGGGKFEIETVGGIEKQRLYLDGSPYTASILLEKTDDSPTQIYYLHRDYLGSITQITDNSAKLAAEYSYDAWGRMRNVNNWQVYAQGSQPNMLYGMRGYTGHEQLNGFGIINMNARLYDPVLARFLAPDPLVGSGMTNDFNRYIYCRNNPMMYTDPSGMSFKDWWNRNIAEPFMREVNQVFGNGFTVSLGTNTQFSSMKLVGAPNGPNGMPYGPGFGVQTVDWKTPYFVSANYQGGFSNTQPLNFENNLQRSVVQAEQKARSEYFGQKAFESVYNFMVNLTNLAFKESEYDKLYGEETQQGRPIDFDNAMNVAGTTFGVGAASEEMSKLGYKNFSTIAKPFAVYNAYTAWSIINSPNVNTLNYMDLGAGLLDVGAAFGRFGYLNPYVGGATLIYSIGRIGYDYYNSTTIQYYGPTYINNGKTIRLW